jgi:hypothetical protein
MMAPFPASGPSTITGAADLTGSGSLSARPLSRGDAALSGSGTLSATAEATLFGVAALSGSGTLSASTGTSLPGEADLYGVGVLTATPGATYLGVAALAGEATLSASASAELWASGSITGSGTLEAEAYGVTVVEIDTVWDIDTPICEFDATYDMTEVDLQWTVDTPEVLIGEVVPVPLLSLDVTVQEIETVAQYTANYRPWNEDFDVIDTIYTVFPPEIVIVEPDILVDVDVVETIYTLYDSDADLAPLYVDVGVIDLEWTPYAPSTPIDTNELTFPEELRFVFPYRRVRGDTANRVPEEAYSFRAITTHERNLRTWFFDVNSLSHAQLAYLLEFANLVRLRGTFNFVEPEDGTTVLARFAEPLTGTLVNERRQTPVRIAIEEVGVAT